MNRLIAAVIAVLVLGLTGCSKDTGPDPTIPPMVPTQQIIGSILPAQVAGYSALGSAPVLNQMQATYAKDSKPLELAVVTLDLAGTFRAAKLDDQQWYGPSRCGLLWEGDSDITPLPQQVACITPLIDGVMTTVSGGTQTAYELSELANAIYHGL
ncbi:MAG: hypothetical protein LBE83_02370 [Propionibacteriaceae bacterium]|jgi:hypothetical protein|nr:hypothetical protein [Propionibacteriaceae bacterium]